MYPQSCQATQLYQVPHGYAASHNQLAQLSGNQPSSSNSNYQGPCAPSHNPVSSQHGIYASQANYHGDGSYGMSVNSPAVPTPAQTLCSSHGYNVLLASAQNMQMVQPHQGALAHSSHIQSSGPAQTIHGMNNTQSFLAQNKPRETTQDWCSNNLQTNMNINVPNGKFQMSNGQPQTTVYNRSADTSSHQTQTVPLQQSSYQNVNVSSLNNHNTYAYSCQTQQLTQASNQAQAQNRNLQYTSNQGNYGHVQSSQHFNTTRVKQRNNNVVQLNPQNSVHREQQNIQTNSMLNTEGYAVQPRQNNRIHTGMNDQNLTQASSQRSNYQIINWQIFRGNSTATSPTMTSSPLFSNLPNSAPASSAMNQPPPSYHDTILSCTYGNTNQNNPSSVNNSPKLASPSSTNSLHVPLGMNTLQSPRSQTHSLAAPPSSTSTSSPGSSGFLPTTARVNGSSWPPHLMLGPNSVDPNQTVPAFLSNSSRNAGTALNHANVRTVHGATVQQQNSPVDSAQSRSLKQQQQQRCVLVCNNHAPNITEKCDKSLLGRNQMLVHLLVKDNIQTTGQNISCCDNTAPIMSGSPNRSVQIHRAVAVVPPISKQPAEGDKNKEYNDHLSLLIKDLRSLVDTIDTKEAVIDTDCAASTKTSPGVTSSEVSCRPEDDAVEKSTTYSNSNPLNNLSSEKKDTSKDENSEQLPESHVFFGMPVVTYSLRMLRDLVVDLDFAKKEQTTRNTPDFARSILDLYWGGNYENYIETELGGAFANVLKEAAEFDIDEDMTVCDVMKEGDLNHLNQMGSILTNCFDGDIAMEVYTSSWRYKVDESLDIDEELPDTDFTRQDFGSLHCTIKSAEQHNDIHTRSVNKDCVSKEDAQLPSSSSSSSSVTKSDFKSLNCTVLAVQPQDVKLDSQAGLKQIVTIPITGKNSRQDDSRMDHKEDDLCPRVQVVSVYGHSHQNQAPADPLRDTVHKTSGKCDNKSSTQCFTRGLDWTNALIMTSSSSEDSVNLDHNNKDCKTYLTEDDCKLSVTPCKQVKQEKEDCAISPCVTMPHIELTVLSSETDMVDSENQHHDLINSAKNVLPSPIQISEPSSDSDQGSPKSLDPVLSMQITVLSADELKALAVEFYSDSDNSVHNIGMSSSPICIDSEDDDNSELDSVHTGQTDGETTKQAKISTPIGVEIPSIHSIKEALTLLKTKMTVNRNKQMANSAEKEPASPPRDERKRRDPQEQNDHQHPSQSCHSPPLKKCKVEPLGDSDNSEVLPVVLSPSDQSSQDMAKNYSQHSDTDMTKTPDLHLDRASSTESSEMPKSSDVDKKRKRMTFKLYGAQKSSLKEANGKTQYYTDSDRDLPPLLNILYSPNKTSAKDKIKKSWEDSFVPTPIKYRKKSGSESENREIDVPERPTEKRTSGKEHQSNHKSSKDKNEHLQQQPSKTKHQSKHKKRKHRSFSLTALREEAERMGKSNKSPHEKQNMGLQIIKQYKRIHEKM